MENSARINNILLDNVLFVDSGENTIFTNNMVEEFFGVYNINIGDKNILCESNSPDKIYCEVIFKGNVYNNIPFNVVKSDNSKIIINKTKMHKTTMNEDVLANQILKLKREIRELSKQKTILNENVESNYRQELLNEFFKVTEENERIIEDKISTLGDELSDNLQKTLEETVDNNIAHFKKENSESLKTYINKFYSKISISNKKDIEELTESFKNDIRKEYESKISKDLLSFKEDKKTILEEFSNVNKNTVDVMFEGIETSKKKLLESFELSLDKHKRDFSEKFVKEFETLIENKQNDIKNQTEKLLENQNKNNISLFEKKKNEIENSSKQVITEANKKIKDLEKKVETISNQLNKSNREKSRLDSLLQDSRKYTDGKIAQVLEESKRFTRIMMDMVGGGSGSVAVQYAAGGTINGDLNVTGGITGNSVLSGGKNLTEIFAGEGEGDNNLLSGGNF